jgi:hypothetical protein
MKSVDQKKRRTQQILSFLSVSGKKQKTCCNQRNREKLKKKRNYRLGKGSCPHISQGKV